MSITDRPGATTLAGILAADRRACATPDCVAGACDSHEDSATGTAVMCFARLRHAPRALAAIAIAAVLHSSATLAGTLAAAGGYELQPDVVGAGGTTMHGGTWTLDGTIAQPDAIVQDGVGGIRLEGGFWHATAVVPVNDRIFANGFDESPPISGGAQHRP